ncbi:MAG TPA: UPF0179 family protein [Methanospirillum sp.]|nr:UPF0179 family protein [Methanospirillum sp.]
MEQKKTRVTIVGSAYAKPGYQFVYSGKTSECESCSITRVCHNLEPGRRYEVVAIRAATHHCPIHNQGAVTVDVIEAAAEICVAPELAKKNTTITIKLPHCDETCDQYADCHPEGIGEGQKYIITEITSTDLPPCRAGLSPVLVKVIPLPEGLPRYST